ncbi:MAG: hypothetical protein ACFB51_12440 [Anaerolineae bacterium]
MPTTIQWLDREQTVILVHHEGDYTTDDVIEQMQIVNAMIDTVEHAVIVLQDYRLAGQLKGNMLVRIQELNALRHPRSINPVMVGPKGLMRTMIRIYSQVFREIQTCETVHEAVKMLGIEPLPSVDIT